MKILFIACYSPLINNSASIETLQYLNNLAKIDGNEIHLLTVNFPPNSIYYDEYIFSMLNKNIKLHIISGGRFFESLMPKKSNEAVKVIDNTKTSKIKPLLKKAKKMLAIPDMYLYWAYKASKYGKELMEKENFDVMFSMHEPPSSHICAYNIKKGFKDLRWIAYWSDPWLKDSTREGSSYIRRTFEGRYEEKIVELVDKHIFVTKANRNDYIKTYNLKEEDTFIITRGYDSNIYDEILKEDTPKLIDKSKINLVYAGEIFSKLRDIRPFISSLNKLEEENEELFNKLNVLFFGNIDNDEIKQDLMNIKNVKVSNRIPYKEALGYMVNADVLLLFGNKNSKQIPAKIYDYFGCYGYILVILGDEEDPIINVIKDIDKCKISLNRDSDITNCIEDLASLIKNGEKSYLVKEYEWENISKKLDSILRGE